MMALTVDQILTAFDALGDEEQAQLAEEIFSRFAANLPTLHPQWEAGLKRRIAEFNADPSIGISADVAIENARKRLRSSSHYCIPRR